METTYNELDFDDIEEEEDMIRSVLFTTPQKRAKNRESKERTSQKSGSVKENKDLMTRRGEAKQVLGATDSNGKLRFYIEWSDCKRALIDSEIAYQLCPQLVIQFFESQLQCND